MKTDFLAIGAEVAPPADVRLSVDVQIIPDQSSPEEWDAFAAACGGSFRTTYRGAMAWQLDYHLFHRLHRFAIMREKDGDLIRVGQVAIGRGLRRNVFAEGFQLLPGHAECWRPAMAAILERLGRGKYVYGSQWSLEQPRQDDLSVIPGVQINDVHVITTHAVVFSQWDSWETYFRAISQNAKRNANRAESTYGDLKIVTREGMDTLRDMQGLLGLQRQLFARKNVAFSMPRQVMRFMLRARVMGSNAFTAIAKADGEAVAAFSGIRAGANTYYMDAGSLKTNNGVSWFLLLRMLREAYMRAPKGCFVTGAYHEGAPVSDGIDFFRRQCRTTGHPTSEVTFSYAPD
jgi:hypothetical protein